ncbi:hypothetical protein GCM10010371_45680 [Streptomyces subrutilus]|uniref:Uncharacterized protein n=1 Tax=Streptomyces subrutilus TaxID=36818 RepID=A0A918V944_9ACTN|nr:hypothetical protein GCM10010371_45680 [Streptomyces subrutilus]
MPRAHPGTTPGRRLSGSGPLQALHALRRPEADGAGRAHSRPALPSPVRDGAGAGQQGRTPVARVTRTPRGRLTVPAPSGPRPARPERAPDGTVTLTVTGGVP